ncbi:MAG: hypothetical protein ABT02_00300 [Comamonadaceae bacterium SCN 68-20]|nr:TonB-dependent receptor [Comamonadaceae bacterium]ODU61634.1 MAG: hypothetical protein ABT02_00300 [Comamonadaceae bacterium SCN 68-20]OJX08447.1 MAG: hypothetical protein BGO75_18360 [Burkholderiales bacterium 68-20]
MPSSRFISPIRPIAAAMLSLVAAWAQAAPLAIDLPAQPLSTSIQQLSRQSGLSIGGDAALLEGKNAPAVHGTLEPADALRKLLQGSGLSADFGGNKAVIRKAASVLKEVVVSSDAVAIPQEGSAEAGYKPQTAKAVGPLGDKPILDTPYSMTVMSADLIQNSVTATPDQLYKMNPQTQLVRPSASYTFGAVVMRGTFSRFALDDGMLGDGTDVLDIEALDRMQVLTGPTNFLYGATQPGGRVNYVYKNPTHERINDITAGSYGGSSRFVHADLGGNIDSDGVLSYRVNALTQDGDLSKDGGQKRSFIRAAVNWKPVNGMTWQGYYSYGDLENTGNVMTWSKAAGAVRPSAPDVNRNWAQPWTWTGTRVEKLGGKLDWSLNENLGIRAAYQRKNRIFKGYLATDNEINGDGTYTTTYWAGGRQTYDVDTGYLYLDYSANILGARNKLTVGYAGYDYDQTVEAATRITPLTLGTTAMGNHDTYPKPEFTTSMAEGWSYLNRYKTYTVGNELSMGNWSVLASLSYTKIKAGYPDGSDTYDKGKISPTGALIYKLNDRLSTYVSYAEALDRGNIAGTTYNGLPVTNANTVQEPTVSKQVEIGAKADVGGLLLGGALFRLDQASTRYLDNGNGTYTFATDGKQRFTGVELTAVGRPMPRLTVFGGLTLMKAEVVSANAATAASPSTKGYVPWGIAQQMAKLTVEYDVASVPGLTLTGGAYYTGKSYADNYEMDKLAGYTLFDAGLRYGTKFAATPITLRLSATNLTNKSYWMWAGQNAATAPRSLALSVTARF